MRMNKDRKRGFTLIELLVVVSIIAVLVSILMPALGTAKEHARRVVCSSNLHQVAIAAVGYAVENKDYFPPGSVGDGILSPHVLDITVARSFKELDASPWPQGDLTANNEYAAKPTGLWQCPSNPIFGEWDTSYGTRIYMSYVYVGWHENIGGIGLKYDAVNRVLAGTGRKLSGRRGLLVADRCAHGNSMEMVYANHGDRGVELARTLVPSGMNRGFSDGSASWVNGRELLSEFDLTELTWVAPARGDCAYSHNQNAYWW